MKKRFLVAGIALLITSAVPAQTKKAPLPPPERPENGDAGSAKDYQDFLHRNPSVASVQWNEKFVFIVPKSGKTEQYPLTAEGLKQAESKYGKLPAGPPPPPPPPPPPVPPVPPPPIKEKKSRNDLTQAHKIFPSVVI